MKKLKIWSMMMLMAMALPTIVACGGDDGDDDENGGKLPLTVENIKGSWSTGYASNYQGYYKYITFSQSGNGAFFYYNDAKMLESSSFTFNYTISEGKVVLSDIYWVDGSKNNRTESQSLDVEVYENRLIIKNWTPLGTYSHLSE